MVWTFLSYIIAFSGLWSLTVQVQIYILELYYIKIGFQVKEKIHLFSVLKQTYFPTCIVKQCLICVGLESLTYRNFPNVIPMEKQVMKSIVLIFVYFPKLDFF